MKFSPFSVILIFIALMMAGLAMLSRLNVNLYPTETLPSFRISFGWPEMPALTVEKEVSSKLEAAMGVLNGVKAISSVSGSGRGDIFIEFNKGKDTDMTRFEIASKIRQLYPGLPTGVSYPVITAIQATGSRNNLLLYTLTVPQICHKVNHYLDEVILPALAKINGINNVAFYGACPAEFNIVYDEDKIQMLGILPDQVMVAVNDRSQLVHLGMSYQEQGADTKAMGRMPVALRSDLICFPDDLPAMPIKRVSGRVIYLGDIAEVSYSESVPRAYYRIDGKSTILIAVDADSNENRITLAGRVKTSMDQFKKEIPETWVLQLAYDDTVHIRNDMKRVALRMVFSLAVLLFLVLLITRNHQYFLLLLLTITANVLIAASGYYLFNIEINLYSLAGITVSFGVIIDNSIVMIEHLRRHNNKAVFLALLAATLTTAASLLLVFLMDSSRQVVLKDFAAVMLVNLLASLLIAWFFISSIWHCTNRLQIVSSTPKRWLFYFRALYLRWLLITQRYRIVLIICVVMAFGLPLQYLPARLAGDGTAAQLYNATIGSDAYQARMKHGIERVFGGSFRLFAENVFRRSYYVDPERTRLLVRARMPAGSNVHQLNEAVIQMEKHLMLYHQVEHFQTRVLSHENAYIRILFRPAYDNEAFSVYFYEQLAEKVLTIGGVEWHISGAGQGFSNFWDGNAGQVSIILEGYNYDMLYRIAKTLEMLSEKNSRITNQRISGSMAWTGEKEQYEIFMMFDKKKLAFMELYAHEVIGALPGRNKQQMITSKYHNKKIVNMWLVPGDQTNDNFWAAKNKILLINDLHVLPKSLMAFEKRRTDADIHKHNQQYRLFFHFDFNGPCRLREHVTDQLVKMISAKMPVGYHASKLEWSRMEEQKNNDYLLVLLVIVIVFFMCAILFESLRQPLAVVCVIPVSFIGLFLTFYTFKLNFDQGGIAAFVLLSGLSVNAALYLLNDFNLFRKKNPGKNPAENYLCALDCKIMPVSLTVISTVAGMTPFIIGKKEAFWFAFAAGTIGGMMFSFCAVLFLLPLFLNLNKQKHFYSINSHENV